MSKVAARIVKALEPHGVLAADAETIAMEMSSNSTYRTLKTLLANRVTDFDTECIDEAEGYVFPLRQLAGITRGDWQPGTFDIDDSGVLETVTIRFAHGNSIVQWVFEQDGSDYMANDFFVQLVRFARDSLPGRFVLLPVNDQGQAVCYLPAKAAVDLHKVLYSRALRELCDDESPPFEGYDKDMYFERKRSSRASRSARSEDDE